MSVHLARPVAALETISTGQRWCASCAVAKLTGSSGRCGHGAGHNDELPVPQLAGFSLAKVLASLGRENVSPQPQGETA
jgi:hypothetical protein